MIDSIESAFYVSVLLIYKENNSLHYTLESYKCAADKQIRTDIGALIQILQKQEIRDSPTYHVVVT